MLELGHGNTIAVESARAKSPSLNLSDMVDSEGDYLFAYALRSVRDQSLAEDIVQETFLAASHSIKNFQGMSSPRTWLTAILRHKIVDAIRKNIKEDAVFSHTNKEDDFGCYFEDNGHWNDSSMPISWETSPEKAVENKQFIEAVEKCISKLPLKLRQVFLLRESEGMEIEEICNSLEISATNLRVTLHRCRVHLRSCLERGWFSDNTSGEHK